MVSKIGIRQCNSAVALASLPFRPEIFLGKKSTRFSLDRRKSECGFPVNADDYGLLWTGFGPFAVCSHSPGEGHDAGRFAGRCQNRVQERPPGTVGEVGGSTGDNLGAALGEPIAFFTASQITSREKGFSRKLAILSFCALNATAAGSYPEIRMIGVAPHFERICSATSSPEPSGNL